MYAAKVKNRPNRIGVYLGPGGGKSRIAATIGWLALNKNLFQKVVFIHPNEYVRRRE